MNRQTMIDAIYEKIAERWKEKEIWYYYIYKTISLARVLSALWYDYLYHLKSIYRIAEKKDLRENELFRFNCVCERKLLTDSGEDAYLDDQSDETIKAIHDLLLDK